MVKLQIVCVLLAVASGCAELSHSTDHAASDTIYRETVALGGPVSHAVPVPSHSDSVGHARNFVSPSNYVSHAGQILNHGGSVGHAAHVGSHADLIVSHGGSVSHSTPIVTHGGYASHDGSVLSHDGLVNHASPVLSYDALVNHAGPVVSHSGLVNHAGSVLSHGGLVKHSGSLSHDGSVGRHSGSVSHGHPVSHGDPIVSQAPTPYAPVISHESGYQEPVRSQYHAQDAYGRYSFGYNAGTSARDETRDAYGNVHGSFTYIDSYGNLQTQHYVAGKNGFQVEGTNLPVQVSHEQRHKRSYAIFPASTEPLVNSIPSGHVTTVTRHQQGPVVVGHPGTYRDPYSHGSEVEYQPPVVPNEGLVHAKAYGVSPLLGNANLHGNFDKFGYSGFSYGFNTGPSSLTTYGSHFNQHNPSYSH